MAKIISCTTKECKKFNGLMNEWIDRNGPTDKLIKWYLKDPESLETLERIRNKLAQEYQRDLAGDTRIKLNHLNVLLEDGITMSPEIRLKFFNTFFNHGDLSWKYFLFEPEWSYGVKKYVPLSLKQ